jgi:hypothetical protein
VSGKTGLSNKQVQQLMMLAIPLLLKYMTKNASSGNGAQSLLGALSQHTSKRDMDKQLDDADEEDGGKIIHHILGSNQGKVTQDLSAQAQTIATQAQDVLTDLQTVTYELTQVDMAGMVSNVDSLVTSSQEAVTQATEKLEAIDIDALNSAIADLYSVVGPLADLVENLSFF